MSTGLTRKEMKRDEFASAVGRSVEYAESHTRNILFAIGGLVVLAALVFGVRAYFGHRSDLANRDLAYALKVAAAPIQVPTADKPAKPTDPDQPTFADEASRQARAKELFEAVRRDHGSTDAADVAGLHLAHMAASAGKLDEARQLWSQFVDRHKDSAAAAEARLNLFDLDRKQGKGEQVVGTLRPMLDDAAAPLPKDLVLYQLGVTYAQMERRQEAIGSFQQLVDEFPQSGFRQEAQQKLTTLDPSRAAQNALGALGAQVPGGRPPGL